MNDDAGASMTGDDLFQQCLELEYGLLESDEAERLRRRIAEEPEVARIHAEVLRTRLQIAQATRKADPTFDPRPLMPSADRRAASGGARPRVGRVTDALLALACGLLIAVGLGNEWSYRSRRSSIDESAVVVEVAGPTRVLSNASTPFELTARNILSQPVSTPLDVSLVNESGESVFSDRLVTDRSGQATLRLPEVAHRTRFTLYVKPPNQPLTATPLDPGMALRVARIVTDRPDYRPGERMYLRGEILERASLTPVNRDEFSIDLRSVAGQPVEGWPQSFTVSDGIIDGSWDIPTELPDGHYELLLRGKGIAIPLPTRSVRIHRQEPPRLHKRLDLAKSSFAPSEKVHADLWVERAEGGAIEGATANARLMIAGTVTDVRETKLDATGRSQVELALPPVIERGPAELVVDVAADGQTETITRELSIVRGGIDLEFFPESGDLVAGLMNRVYFQALDVNGKGVDVAGRVVDEEGKVAAEFQAQHQGRGILEMTPGLGQKYSIEITAPEGTHGVREFAPSSSRKVLMRAPRPVLDPDEKLPIEIRATEADIPLIVSVYCRNVPAAFALTKTSSEPVSVSLDLPASAEGVLRVTLFDRRKLPLEPVAERLVYRMPSRKLSVDFDQTSERVPPGATIEAAIRVRDEKGNPASRALLGIHAVDRRAFQGVETTTPGISTYFLLLSEIDHPRDIEDAQILVGASDRSRELLDLVLGTHGWRRFRPATLQNQLVFLADQSEAEVDPPLAVNNQVLAVEEARAQRASLDARTQMGRIFIGSTLLLMLLLAGILHWTRGMVRIVGMFVVLVAVTLSVVLTTVKLREHVAQAESTPEMAIPPSTVTLQTPAPSLVEAATKQKKAADAQHRIRREMDRRAAKAEAFATKEAPAADAAVATEETARPEIRSREMNEAQAGAAPPPQSAEAPAPPPAAAPVVPQVVDAPPPEAVASLPELAAAPADEREASRMRRAARTAPAAAPVVREFAYAAKVQLPALALQPTRYWNPRAQVDEAGKFTARFEAPAEPTVLIISVDGLSPEGRLGDGTREIKVDADQHAK